MSAAPPESTDGNLPSPPPGSRERPDRLAIVIPAYKAGFLRETLASIAAQTDQDFRLWVADDGSPEDVAAVVRAFAPVFGERLSFRRFDDNLGARSLAGHWTRAIALSDEPWVWLFSDDDVMAPGCVAAFRAALARTAGAFDLYRFNSETIDEGGRVVASCPPHPERETWPDFAYHLLSGSRLSNQQELIFRREAMQRVGGFLDLPLAWFTDHAFAFALMARTGAFTITTCRLRFRQSGRNISSTSNAATDRDKQRANQAYTGWLLDFVDQHDCGDFPGRDLLRALARKNFLRGLWLPRRWIGVGQAAGIVRFMRARLGMSAFEAWARIGYYDVCALFDRLKHGVTRRFARPSAAGGSPPA